MVVTQAPFVQVKVVAVFCKILLILTGVFAQIQYGVFVDLSRSRQIVVPRQEVIDAEAYLREVEAAISNAPELSFVRIFGKPGFSMQAIDRESIYGSRVRKSSWQAGRNSGIGTWHEIWPVSDAYSVVLNASESTVPELVNQPNADYRQLPEITVSRLNQESQSRGLLLLLANSKLLETEMANMPFFFGKPPGLGGKNIVEVIRSSPDFEFSESILEGRSTFAYSGASPSGRFSVTFCPELGHAILELIVWLNGDNVWHGNPLKKNGISALKVSYRLNEVSDGMERFVYTATSETEYSDGQSASNSNAIQYRNVKFKVDSSVFAAPVLIPEGRRLRVGESGQIAYRWQGDKLVADIDNSVVESLDRLIHHRSQSSSGYWQGIISAIVFVYWVFGMCYFLRNKPGRQ